MPIFDVQTHIDFYNMFVDDFDDFMREQYSARRAFHCVNKLPRVTPQPLGGSIA